MAVSAAQPSQVIPRVFGTSDVADGPTFIPRHAAALLRRSLTGIGLRERLLPLRKLVPAHVRGSWHRAVGSSHLLRAVTSRDEVWLRFALGGKSSSPMLPLPPATVPELLSEDDRGRTALDWANLMEWQEGVELLGLAYRKALVMCEQLEEFEASLREAVQLASRNQELAQQVVSAIDSTLETDFIDGITKALQRATLFSLRPERLREALGLLAKVSVAEVKTAIAHADDRSAGATGSEACMEPTLGKLPIEAIGCGTSSPAELWIDRSGRDGTTAAQRCAQSPYLDILSTLVDCGASVGSPGCEGLTPLGAACSSGHETVARMLVARGADAFSPARNGGTTALMLAARAGHSRIVRWLLGLAKQRALGARFGLFRDPFEAPSHWCQDYKKVLVARDNAGLTAAAHAAASDASSDCRRILDEALHRAEAGLQRWMDERTARQWSNCSACGDRVRTEDVLRHNEHLCAKRHAVTPPQHVLGLRDNRDVSTRAFVRGYQMKSVLGGLKPSARHQAGIMPQPSDDAAALDTELAPSAATRQNRVVAAGQAIARHYRVMQPRYTNILPVLASAASPAPISTPTQANSPPQPKREAELESLPRLHQAPARSLSGVVCPSGCGQALRNRQDLLRHLARRCPQRMIRCRLGCGELLPAVECDDHAAKSCPFRRQQCACGIVVCEGQMHDHLREQCALRTIFCPQRCGLTLPACSVEAHIRSDCCQVEEPCPSNCGAVVARALIRGHMNQSCPKRAVPCPNGCGLPGLVAMAVEDHATHCQLTLIQCSHCGKPYPRVSLPGHSAICDSRPSQVCPSGCGALIRVGRAEQGALDAATLKHEQTECPRRKEPCQRGCGALVDHMAMTTHLDHECERRVVTCPRGCGDLFHAPMLQFHELRCPRRNLSCEFRCRSCTRQLRSWMVGPAGDSRMLLCKLHGSSPLYHAAACNDLQVLELLADGIGADELDRVNMQGLTPAAVAARAGNSEALTLLLSHGVNVAVPTERGLLVLNLCVEGRSLACAKLLLAAGANPHTQDSRGTSAMALARRSNDDTLFLLFRNHTRVRESMAAMHRAILLDDARTLQSLLGRKTSTSHCFAAMSRVPGHRFDPKTMAELPAVWLNPSVIGQMHRKAVRTAVVAQQRVSCLIAAAAAAAVVCKPCRGDKKLAGAAGSAETKGERLPQLQQTLPTSTIRVSARLADPIYRPAFDSDTATVGRAFFAAKTLEQELDHCRLLHEVLNSKTPLRHSLLTFAACCGSIDCCTILIGAGAPVEFTASATDAAATAIQAFWRLMRPSTTTRPFSSRRHTISRRICMLERRLSLKRIAKRFGAAMDEERLPLWEAALNGHPKVMKLLHQAGARSWRRTAAFPDSPPPYAVQQPPSLLLRASTTPGGKTKVSDALVSIPVLDPEDCVPRADDPFAGFDDEIPRLDLSVIDNTSTSRPPAPLGSAIWAAPPLKANLGTKNKEGADVKDRWVKDPVSGVLRRHTPEKSTNTPRGAFAARLFRYSRLIGSLIGCHVIPRRAYLVETAALGFARFGHRSFINEQGWVRKSGYTQAMALSKEMTRVSAVARYRSLQRQRLSERRAKLVQLHRELKADMQEAIRLGDASLLIRCLAGGLRPEHVDLWSGHNAATAAATMGCVEPGDRSKTALLVDVVLDRFATDPATLMDDVVEAAGVSPLMAAAKMGHARVVGSLLARGASLAAVAPASSILARAVGVKPLEVRGATALHLSAACGRLEVTRLLLGAGADPLATTDSGATAADLAAANGHQTVATELLACVSGQAKLGLEPVRWGIGNGVGAL